MPTLNPNEYAYLWSPTRQMLDKNGKPLVGGYVMLDQHGTPGVEAISYCDWNGTLNARQIMLDSLGRASAIVENDKLYDMYVYNRYNVLTYSALGVNCNGGGEGSAPLRFTSSDGTITIYRSGNDVDLTVHTDTASQGAATADSEGNNGVIEFDTVTDGNISVIGVGSLSINPGKLYHVTLQVELSNSTQSDVYYECTLLDSENISHKFTLDGSRAAQIVDLSWDLRATNNYVKFFVNAPDSVTVTAATLYIHAVAANVNASSGIASVVTDGTTIAGNGTEDSPLSVINNLPSASSSDEGKVLTVDSNGDPNWEDPQPLTQVQSDWTESDTSAASYIQHKPNLAAVATSGSYNDLSNKPSIPAAQVNSDWNASSGVAQILNKPNLATVATTGSYNDLSNKPTIPEGVPSSTPQDAGKVLTVDNNGDPNWAPGASFTQQQSDWTQSDSSAVDYIKNKPTIPTKTSDLTNDSGFITSAEIPPQQQANWNETDVSDPSYIQNKPTIPAAQVNSDWNAASGVAQILNKPSIPTATSDLTNDSGYITASDVPAAQTQANWNESDSSNPAYIKNKPTIPAAQVNSDWNASSGVAQILNKPTLATVATTGSYTDLSNTPTIPDGVPTVTSSDNGKVLTASYSGGVGSYSWILPSGYGEIEIVDVSQLTTRFGNFTSFYNEITAGKYFILTDAHTWSTNGSTNYYTISEIIEPEVGVSEGQVYFTCFDGRRLDAIYEDTLHITGSDVSISMYHGTIETEFFLNNDWIDTNYTWYIPYKRHVEGELLIIQNVGHRLYMYKCIKTYFETSHTSYPSNDTTHWQRVYLEDILNEIIKNQVQSDWNESDNTSLAYIKNKPNLATVATSGSYNDLSNKPTIPDPLPSATSSDEGKVLTVDSNGDPEWENPPTFTQQQADWNQSDNTAVDYIKNKPTIPAAQVNSDWNAASGVAQILNKPSLATVATSGSYNDLSNKPTIPAAQVNSDWNASSGVAQILNKPTLATVATSGSYHDLLDQPTINNVPIPGTGEDGMVLTASYSGGVGTYAWAAAPAGTVTDVTVNGTSVVTQGVAAVTVPVIGTITL